MKLIERYIFRRGFLATLVTVSSLTGVVWIVQALRQVDIIATKGQTIVAYLMMTTLAVPALMQAIVPLALMIGAVYTINTLNTNSELVVINASGASNWVMSKPLLVLAMLVSLFAGYVAHFVSPMTLVSIKEKSSEIAADLVTVIVREGEFNEIEDGLVFHIERRGDGGILRGIVISDDRDETKSILFTADKGIITRLGGSPFLLLQDGEIHQKNLLDGSVSIIRYQSYAFDLSTFSGKSREEVLRPKERSTWDLLNPNPNDKFYQEKPSLYTARIHERFSEMLWPFAYVLVILAFSGQARSTRQGHAGALWTAITILICLRGGGFYAVSATKSNENGYVLLYLFPMLAILFGSYFVATNRALELPKRVQDRIDLNNAWLVEQFQALNQLYLDFRRKIAGVRS